MTSPWWTALPYQRWVSGTSSIPVSVLVFGSQLVQPNSATGVPGVVGITMVQVTLPTVMPTGAPLSLSVTVNGKASSTMPLPIQ